MRKTVKYICVQKIEEVVLIPEESSGTILLFIVFALNPTSPPHPPQVFYHSLPTQLSPLQTFLVYTELLWVSNTLYVFIYLYHRVLSTPPPPLAAEK